MTSTLPFPHQCERDVHVQQWHQDVVTLTDIHQNIVRCLIPFQAQDEPIRNNYAKEQKLNKLENITASSTAFKQNYYVVAERANTHYKAKNTY